MKKATDLRLRFFLLIILWAMTSPTYATIDIGGILSIDGNITLSDDGSQETGAAANMEIFIGEGQYRLPNNSLNPNARGILIDNAVVGIVKVGSNYAVVATGSGLAVGIPNFTLTGNMFVRFNMLGTSVSENLTVQGTSDLIDVTFLNGDAVSVVAGADMTLDVGGTSIFTDFNNIHKRSIIIDSATEAALQLELTNTAIVFQKSSTTLLSLNGGEGDLLLMPNGAALSLIGAPYSEVISLSGGATLQVNTTTSAVDESFIVNGAERFLTVDAGPFAKVFAQELSLNISGQEISANFAFQQVTGGLVVAEISNLVTHYNDGTNDILSMFDGSGLLLVDTTGLGLEATGNVVFDDTAASIESSLSLIINDHNSTIDETFSLNDNTTNFTLAGGPYVKMLGSNAQLNISGQILNGDFDFQQDLNGNVIAQGLHLSTSFCAANTDVLNLTNGNGAFLFTASGTACDLAGSFSLTDSALSLTGSLNLQVNTGPSIDTTVNINGSSQSINLSAGPLLAAAGSSIELSLMGQVLTGDFSFHQLTNTGGSKIVVASATGIQSTFSDGSTDLLTFTEGSGIILLSAVGTATQISGSVAFDDTNLTASGSYSFLANTTSATVNETFDFSGANQTLALPSGPYVKIINSDSVLNILNQSLTGNFDFQHDSSGAVFAQASNVSSGFNNGSSDLIAIENGSGVLLLTTDGTSAEITGGTSFSDPTVTAAANFSLQVSSASNVVDQTVSINGMSQNLLLPVGPLNRMVGSNATLVVLGANIISDVTFERLGDGNVQGLLANASMALNDGSNDVLTLVNGSGVGFLASAGTGFSFAGNASFNAPDLALSGSIYAVINSGSPAIDQTISFNGSSASLTLAGGPYVQVVGNTSSLNIRGESFTGNFTFTEIDGGFVHVAATDVSYAQGVDLIQYTQSSGSLFLFDDEIAGELLGETNLSIPGLTSSGIFGLQINTANETVDIDVTVDGSNIQTFMVAGPYTRLVAVDTVVTVAGQSLSGDYSFQRSAADSAILSMFNVTFNIGAGVIDVFDGTGSLSINATGAAGTLSIPTLIVDSPSVTISGAASPAEMNTRVAEPYFRIPMFGANIALNDFWVGSSAATFTGDLQIDPFNSQARLRIENASSFSHNGTTLRMATGNNQAELTSDNLRIILPELSIHYGTSLENSLTITSEQFAVVGTVPVNIRPAILQTGSVPLIDFSTSTSSTSTSHFEINPTLPNGFSHTVSGKQLFLNSAVKLDSDDDGLSDMWESLYSSSSTDLLPMDNTDGDRLPAIAEFALGLDPTLNDSPELSSTFTEVEGQSYFSITYPRNPDAIGLVGIFTQRSADLAIIDPWSIDDTTFESSTETNQTDRSMIPQDGQTKEFLRLQFVRP